MSTSSTPRVTLDSVASLYEPAPDAPRVSPRQRAGIAEYKLGRRGALRAMMVLGTAAGLTVIGALPGSASGHCKKAKHRDIGGPCPVNVGNCSPACGPSTVYASACNSSGWHKHLGDYRNRPNQCNGTGSDGWMWYANCSCPSGCLRSFRCHDGCKKVSGSWKSSICRKRGSGCIC